MRVIFNITLTYHWRKTAVGIARVEREILINLYHLKYPFIPVIFIENDCYEISRNDLSQIISPNWIIEDKVTSKSQKRTRFLPQDTDRFISLGSDWSHNIPDKVALLYPNTKNLVTACYDLIPLLLPEFTPDIYFFDQFTYHYQRVYECALKVFCISHNTKKDLLNYWNNKQLLAIPEVKTLLLANLPEKANFIDISQEDSFLNNLKKTGYVMMVSTIEPRKNHRLIVEVWKKLFKDMGEACPVLLIVGKIGWGVDDILHEINRLDVTQQGKIIIRSDINDNYLIRLYQNCLFTVNPSIYEGWGLSATESLAYGKLSICANNSALQEATQSLAIYHHPLDFPSWYTTIQNCIMTPSYLSRFETNILESFQSKNWNDFTSEFLEWVLI